MASCQQSLTAVTAVIDGVRGHWNLDYTIGSMETTGDYNSGLYRGYIDITGYIFGLDWDDREENGNYFSILGSYEL